jgi:DNA invertase Pin-like site-specific DNA recombinase
VSTAIGGTADTRLKAEIRERVAAGLEHARQYGTRSGKPIGRPRVTVSADEVAELRSQGVSWRAIADKLGAGVGTVRRIYQTTAADSTGACQNPTAGIL